MTRSLAVLVLFAAPALAGETLVCGPLVGYDGHDAARVWVAPVTSAARLEVAYASSRSKERRVAFPAAAFGTSVRLEGLEPATAYAYRILVNGQDAATGSFRTGPEPGKPFRGTVALASCMNVRRHARQPAWDALLAEAPDLLLHLGDNVYANSTRRTVLLDWHRAQRRVPEHANVLRSVATLAVWDDHDYGANDSDGTLRGKEESLATFRELWPNPAFGTDEAPGVYFKTAIGDVDVFCLDTRYHRAPNWSQAEVKPMLGEAQFRWLERGLRASKAPFKLIACGTTLNASLKDFWGLYPRERDRLLALTEDVPGMVFATGDIHTSIVLKGRPSEAAAYPIWEVVSSGIAVNADSHSFATLAFDTTLPDPEIRARVVRIGAKGEVVKRTEKVIKASELRAPW